jgi:MoaA/NifB/PqqE/SkfB family radical SAM enzyme
MSTAPAAPRWRERRLIEGAARKALVLGARTLERVEPARRRAVQAALRYVDGNYARALREGWMPPGVAEEKRALGRALVRLIERALEERRLSNASLVGLVGRLVHDVLVKRGDPGPKAAFKERHGSNPPDFLVLSPGKTCNLACVGCYAGSGPAREKLDWATLDRIVGDAHDRWGTRFFVLSGGEPLAWRDSGRGVLDLAERHPDCFFMMYTNGTLLDERVAGRLAELGNVTPAISVEGLRQRTDARRGEGVFERVLNAMRELKSRGVMFGVSLTATRENAAGLLSDEVVDFYFGEMGALYGWIFHYMPIGRGFTLDLMPTADQRVHLLQRLQWLVRERGLFLVDFWNSAAATFGCVAGGRAGGYFHVDWNGAVSPCVFMPYSPVNVRDVFARGGSLDEVWAQPFFAAIRSWQRAYGYRERAEPRESVGNWLRPCLMRDHHAEFRHILDRCPAAPTDANARAALGDPTYREGLLAFDEQLARLTDPLWRRDYLRKRPDDA